MSDSILDEFAGEANELLDDAEKSFLNLDKDGDFSSNYDSIFRALHSVKGSAVVAEEIGKLATMSGKAAEEINELLDSSTKEVNSIVIDIQEKVKSGKVVSQDCAMAFNVIDNTFDKIMSSVKLIASAAKEQELGIKQTNTAMGEMEQVTQKNSKAAENLSAQVNPLADVSTSLGNSVRSLNIVVFGEEIAPKIAGKDPASEDNKNEPKALGKIKGKKLNRASSGWKPSLRN
jgi:methyl-accepting chemotaxis protein